MLIWCLQTLAFIVCPGTVHGILSIFIFQVLAYFITGNVYDLRTHAYILKQTRSNEWADPKTSAAFHTQYLGYIYGHLPFSSSPICTSRYSNRRGLCKKRLEIFRHICSVGRTGFSWLFWKAKPSQKEAWLFFSRRLYFVSATREKSAQVRLKPW